MNDFATSLKLVDATPEMNVVSCLHRAAQSKPDHPAMITGLYPCRAITFGKLWDQVGRVSEGFLAAGLKPGDRAVCMVPFSIELYVFLLGLLKMGGTAVIVDPWMTCRQIERFCAYAEPRAFIGTGKSHLLRMFHPILRDLEVTVTTGSRLGSLPARLSAHDLLSTSGTGTVAAVSAATPALITFTSGSSGEPKGANRTHGFLTAQHEALREEFPYETGDVDMAMFPVFALNNIALGITTVIPQMDFRHVAELDPLPVLDQMRQYGVTTCTASPPFFDRLVSSLRNAGGPCPRLRRILTGGAPVSDEQLRFWTTVLPETDIVVVYGSTEAEPVAHISSNERFEAVSSVRPRSPGYCVGLPVARVRAKVIRIQPGPVEVGGQGWAEHELGSGGIGELIVQGRHIGTDYFRNLQAVADNKIKEPDGSVWHRMGDTGYLDVDGRFWLTGRVHSTIFRCGEPIHAQLVEQAAADPLFHQVASVGLPDPSMGERVVLVISTQETVNEPAIRRRLQEAGMMVDDVVITRKPLPLEPRHNSKIDYTALKGWLAKARGQGRIHAPDSLKKTETA